MRRSIDNIEFVSVGHHLHQTHWELSAHSHPFHEMIVLLQGTQCVDMRGTVTHARTGDVLLYPCRIPHREWTEPPNLLESVFVGFNWDNLPVEAPPRIHDTTGRIQVIANWLMAERGRGSPLWPEIRDSLLHAMIGEYLVLWRHPEGGLIDIVRRHVQDHIAEPISLDSLAQVAGLSKFHLIRRYRTESGRSPMQDVRSIRVERARDLILSTPLPLKEIAPRVGLGDVYHFSRVFKRTTGVAPASLRRRTHTNRT